MKLRPEEPDLGPWHVVRAAAVVAELLQRRPTGRPAVIAIDGRGGGGKSTLAKTLGVAAAEAGHRGAVVHTDDVAWRQARFDWADLLAEHVLRPVRGGRAVRWRPPAWDEHGRSGSIDVPAGTALLFVEGTGAARRQLNSLLDIAVWVQSDIEDAYERAMVRDCVLYDRTRVEAETSWQKWMTEELPHLAMDRPWERADLVVAGTHIGLTYDESSELAVATRYLLRSGGYQN